MRLIDADKIKWKKILEPLGNGMYVDGYVANERDINTMPTIEAIPIDWIRSWWGNQGVPSLSHCMENTDEVIRTMLTDWRKENEND